MNKPLIWTGILVLAVVLGIGAAAALAPALTPARSTAPIFSPQQQAPVVPALPAQPGASKQPAAVTPLPSSPNNRGYYGNGMMGRGGGMGMMGGYGYGYGNNQPAEPLTSDQAKTAAEAYIQSIGLSGLEVAEVMVFSNNAYVVVKESDSGRGAFELLVDPFTPQFAYPEYGPNMMWNLKYGGASHSGMMGGRGGMMGGWNSRNSIPTNVSAEMTVTPEQAIQAAQTYLDQSFQGATAATDPIAFYGYYTLDFEKDGQVIGMLSVNGFTGQIFLHTWHDTFVSEKEYDK